MKRSIILNVSGDIDFWYMEAVKYKLKSKIVSSRQQNIITLMFQELQTHT